MRRFLLSLAAVALSLGSAARAGEDSSSVGTAAGSGGRLPLWGLFASSTGQVAYVPMPIRMNFDISSGLFIPIDGDENFDLGGTMDMKFQAEVLPQVFVGAEFAFAGHDKEAGTLLSEGTLDRFYFLMPIEVDLPFAGHPGNPFSFRLGIAPGFQVADPDVDSDLEDQLFFQGLELDEEEMVAFNLRVRVGLRIPLDPHFGFLVEAAYDWSEASGEAELEDLVTGTTTTARRHVNLSGVSVLFGFLLLF